MTRNKVRAGSVYVFVPVLGDVIDARTDLSKGELVRVVNLPGAPKCNTMGMAHVQRLDGSFAGLVYTNSLQPRREFERMVAEEERNLERKAFENAPWK